VLGRIQSIVFNIKNLSLNPVEDVLNGHIKVVYKFDQSVIAQDFVKVKDNLPGVIYLRTKFLKKYFLKLLFHLFGDELYKDVVYLNKGENFPSFSENVFKIKDVFLGDIFLRRNTFLADSRLPFDDFNNRDFSKVFLYKLSENVKTNGKKGLALAFFTEKEMELSKIPFFEEFEKIFVFSLGNKKGYQKEEKGRFTYVKFKNFDLHEIFRFLKLHAPESNFFMLGSKKGEFPQIEINLERVKDLLKGDEYSFFFPFFSSSIGGVITSKFFERGKSKKNFYYGEYEVSFEDILVNSRIVEDYSISGNFAFFVSGTSVYELLSESNVVGKNWDGFLRSLVFGIKYAFLNGKKGLYSCRESVIFNRHSFYHFPLFYPLKIMTQTFKVLSISKKLNNLFLVYIGTFLQFLKSFSWEKRILFFENSMKLLYLFFLLPLLFFTLFLRKNEKKKRFFKEDISHTLIYHELMEFKDLFKVEGEVANVFYKLRGSPMSFIPFYSYKGWISHELLVDELLLYDSTLFLQKVGELVLDGKIFGDSLLGDKSKKDVYDYKCEVIVATRDRDDVLKNLLTSLKNCDVKGLRDFKITVIDSFSKGDGVKRVCSEFGVNYIRVNKPGKSYALNKGVKNSDADVLFFTDDDAVVDKNWVKRLLESFYDNDVFCVVGTVFPKEIKNRAEHLFEGHHEDFSMGGLRRGFLKQEYCYPFNFFNSAKIGTGANMAIRKRAFDEVGLFDEALSPGTPSRAGEEVDIFFRILKSGKRIVYNPDAIVWHEHRSTYGDLKKILFNYGISSGAFYMRWFLKEGKLLSALYFLRYNIFSQGLNILKKAFFKKCYPVTPLLYELMGSFVGPFLYIYSLIRGVFLYRREN